MNIQELKFMGKRVVIYEDVTRDTFTKTTAWKRLKDWKTILKKHTHVSEKDLMEKNWLDITAVVVACNI